MIIFLGVEERREGNGNFGKTRVANYLKNFNQAASTRCIEDNKEELSAGICDKPASNFCHNRKSAFM